MKSRFLCLAACFLLTAVCSQASAAVVGSFNVVGTIADPFVPADVYDIIEFSIVSDGDVSTLDFTTATGGGFATTGQFGDGAGVSFADAMPVLGPFTLPDSFFVTNPAPPVVSGLLVDSSTQLEAFYSNGGTPLALDGVPTVIAVFTLLQGSGTVNLVGGNADVGGTLTPSLLMSFRSQVPFFWLDSACSASWRLVASFRFQQQIKI